MMNATFKSLYQKSDIGFYLLRPFARLYQYHLHKKYLPREKFVKRKFKKSFGYELDLENPKTLNEKINWLKLNYWHPKATQIADKYEVRKYVQETIGNQFLIPLLFTTKNPKEIEPKNLPDIPCIIKTNHDSSGGIIIRNKYDDHNWKEIQSYLRANMSQNFYWDGREQQYKNIMPRIVVEKLLFDADGNVPADYKVHCFNGQVRMINVDIARGTNNQFRKWFNRNWIKEPYQWSVMFKKKVDDNDRSIAKPLVLELMIKKSEELVVGFPYLRVDWYILDNRLYFGELTFHHIGGCQPFDPPEWDLKLGSELTLPFQD